MQICKLLSFVMWCQTYQQPSPLPSHTVSSCSSAISTQQVIPLADSRSGLCSRRD